MDTNEIKLELPVYNQQCSVCLSAERKLTPLGQYTNIFMIITSNVQYQPSSVCEVMLCWECSSLLHKVYKFQRKVWRTYHLLQLKQKYINKSLSTLTTVLYNDLNSHTVYISEIDNKADEQTETEQVDDIKENDSDDNVEENDFIDTNDFVEIKNENDLTNDCRQNIKEENKAENTKGKKKIRTRWARHRVLQNRKPKFKIITDTTLEDIFNIIGINDREVDTSMTNERERKYKLSEWKCDRCIKGFQKECTLLEHHKHIHSDNRSTYICDICYITTDNKRHLASHIRSHYYKYECKLCEYSTQNKSQRKYHIRTRHKNIYQCVKCKLKFGHRWEFFRHFKKWHEQYICDYCGHIFKMKYCIAEHIRKRHSPYECKTCEKRFARYSGLWVHNKTRHPPSPSPSASPSASPSPSAAGAYCVECDRQYADQYRYKWHLSSSARHAPRKVRRHPCPDCDKVFTKNIYMMEHRDLVHLKHYKYRCESCDKNFLRNAALLKHKKRVHEGILPLKNKICFVCERGFSTNKILQNHMRTHTGERPFACALCDARFAQRVALAAHTRARHHHDTGRPNNHGTTPSVGEASIKNNKIKFI